MQRSESATRPIEVEHFPATGELWLRRNIVTETRTDGNGPYTVFAYEETSGHTTDAQSLAQAHFDTFWAYCEDGGSPDIESYLRQRRESECFTVCDRPLWLETLTETQLSELRAWRQAWLNVTDTLQIPARPNWL